MTPDIGFLNRTPLWEVEVSMTLVNANPPQAIVLLDIRFRYINHEGRTLVGERLKGENTVAWHSAIRVYLRCLVSIAWRILTRRCWNTISVGLTHEEQMRTMLHPLNSQDLLSRIRLPVFFPYWRVRISQPARGAFPPM